MTTPAIPREAPPRQRNRKLLVLLLGLALFMAIWGGWYLSYFGLPDPQSTERYH